MYPQFRTSCCKVQTTWDELVGSSSNLPTLVVIGITFLQSDWKVTDMNIDITNCNASYLEMSVKHSDSINSEKQPMNVNIKNCIFGKWNFETITDIIISNYSLIMNDGELNLMGPILEFSNSVASIENNRIRNVIFTGKQASIVIANRSHITVKGSAFSNFKSDEGLVKVADNSTLVMDQNYIRQTPGTCDGGAVFVANSSAHIQNTFSGIMSLA